MIFKDLGIVGPILKALDKEGYQHPTPIQEKSIPILLRGKDLLACAQTGTGKTAAFSIPIIQNLFRDQRNQKKGFRPIKALIVTPTRELAIQIAESISAYARFTGVRNTVIFGGVKQGAQTSALRRGTDILIATPGRLLDLMSQGFITLEHIEYFVLDEADRMLDMGFIHDIRKIIAQLPKQRQSLFFSATMPPDIVSLSRKILGQPEKVEIQPEQTTAEKVEQAVYHVSKKGKTKLLIHLLKTDPVDSTIVFSRTKHGANRIVKFLDRAGIRAEAIHGNKSQGARQRALGNFKSGDISVLVATDIAARGIDVEELAQVINYDLPNIPETYVHRIGRTGRAGASGVALSFCDVEERPYLRDIQKLIDQKIPVIADHPFLEVEETSTQQTQQHSNQGQRSSRSGNNRNAGGNSSRNKSRRPNWRKRDKK